MTAAIRFGVQAGPMRDAASWSELARRVEDNGFDALYVADHPGVSGSPFVGLAAAAAVTTTLRVGTYVCNTGVREPVALASDAATVDVVSNGRLVLGLGAGHTPAEWTMEGRAYPSAKERMARFGETVHVVERLLAGEVVSFDGRYVQTSDAFLLAPRPVQPRIPLLVGGNGLGLVDIAVRHADILSLTGLGRTLEDGHLHTADWSAPAIDERIERVRAADRPIVLDALVQHVEVSNEPDDVATRIAKAIPGLGPKDVLAAPYVWIGSIDQICEKLIAARERWGFASYVVRENTLDVTSAIIARTT